MVKCINGVKENYMIDCRLVSKCPYCGKLVRTYSGGTYYEYKDNKCVEPRIVHIESHDKCGSYITEGYSLDLTFQPSMTIPVNKKTLSMLHWKIDDMACNHSRDEIVQEVKAELLAYILKNSTEKDKDRNIQSLKDNETYIKEVVDKACNYYEKTDFWSLPLTDEVRDKLKFYSAVMS